MSKKVMILMIGLLAAMSYGAFVSSTSAISTNNCSCHGDRSESLALLVGNAGNTIPTTLNVGQTATVKVVLQHTITTLPKYNILTSITASLASVSGHFSVSSPSVSLGSITGTGTVTATWTITGISAGADSMSIRASGSNPHNAISFLDTYAPEPSINVVAAAPPPPPPSSYTLAVTTIGSGAVAKSPNTATYASGAVVQVTATPAAGWSFTGWNGALTGTTNPASITMNSNKSVTATFTQNPPTPPPPAAYTLTLTTVGSGTVVKSPSAATYTSGSVVQITATPTAGWSFAGWSGGLTGSANPASVTMNSNKAVTATFTQDTPTLPAEYTLTVTTIGSGTVTKSPNIATYTSGTVVQITATPAAGWTFAGWLGSLTGTTSSGSVTMDSNKAITATFTQNPLPPPTTPPSTPPPTSRDDDEHEIEHHHHDHHHHHHESDHESYSHHRSYDDRHDED